MGFKKAIREQLWLRVLLGGPSGSGKTYSALRLATGIAKECGSRIAAIDTENGRMRYYADEFDFDCMELQAPFKPEKYIEAINSAVEAGYKVLIIDSSSHEWKWCYDTANAMPGNSFQNWGKIKAQHHQKYTEAIIQAPIHIINTARGKDEYVMDEKDGKKAPRKVGLGIKAEDDTEYEYTVTFNINQDNHIATVMKDNTHLFENRYEVLTEKDGVDLYKWANSGVEVSKPNTKQVGQDDPGALVKSITSNAKNAIASGIITREEFYKNIEEICGTKAYDSITDVDTLKKILSFLSSVKVGE